MTNIRDLEARSAARLQKRSQEIQSRRSTGPTIGRIGDRASNGRYDLVGIDGGIERGRALKTFDADTKPGDMVATVRRSDNLTVLNGPKAGKPQLGENNLQIGPLEDNCGNYLDGQIFSCVPEKKESLVAWAIGYWESTNTTFAYLLNLNTGETWLLTNIPKKVPPCAPPPPGFPPPQPPSPPFSPDEPWYRHIWNVISWGTPTPRCSTSAPVHPDVIGSISTSTIDLQASADGASWVYRFATGVYLNNFGNPVSWNAASLSTITRNPTPPPIVPGSNAYAVISNELVSSGWAGSYLSVGATNWVYVSAGCAPSESYTPAPPIDSRNPNGPPIDNTIEMTVSIGTDGGPIALIRHTPNCRSPGVWNFEQSTRLVNNNKVTNSGKLTTDWRFATPAFPCQEDLAPGPFINVSIGRDKLWSIEPDDRPDSIAGNGGTETLKITEKQINPADCANPTTAATKEIAVQNNQSNALTIASIAVQWTRR